MSAEFDSWLIIRDEAGNVIAEDDDGGDVFNSRIERPFAAGTYRILATGYSNMDFGAYELSVQAVAPGIVLGDGAIAATAPLPELKRSAPTVVGWNASWGVPER